MVLLGDETQLEARFGSFGVSANLDKIGAWFCAERTIGSKIIFNASDGTPR